MTFSASKAAPARRGTHLQRNRIQATIGAVVILTCLASTFYTYSRPGKNGYGAEHDFVTVIAGSHCIAGRCDPYDSPILEQEFHNMGGYPPTTHFKPEWPVYPPSTLLLLFPLSLLPWAVLSVVWMLLCFGFVTAAYVLLFFKCKAYRDPLSVLPFAILLADGSLGWAIELGQPVLIAASALTLSILAMESAMPLAGALLLTLSLLLKPQVAYLCVAYFLLVRNTRLPALLACLLTGFAAGAGILLFYTRLGSMAYLWHLAANLKLAVRPGGDADFTLRNAANSSSYLNLQALLARFLQDPQLCNTLTYVACAIIAVALMAVCWRRKILASRPYTILAILIMLELLATYHRLYDHVLILAAIPAFYEVRQRGRLAYLLLTGGLFVYHFSQFHGLTIHGRGPFSSGPPVELFLAGVCLHSLWKHPRSPCKVTLAGGKTDQGTGVLFPTPLNERPTGACIHSARGTGSS